MFSRGPISDGSIFVLFRQEDKNFHQVKTWPPTQLLVIKSIVSNIGLLKKAFAMHLVGLVVQIKFMLFISLFIFFIILKFCFH